MTARRLREQREEYRIALGSAMQNVGWNDPAAIPPHGLFNQRHAGVPVTPKTAMQVDTVFTALRVLANGFINMGNPRSFSYGFSEDNRPYKKWDKVQPPVLSNTFGDQYQFDGMTRTVLSLALFGEAWWVKLMYDDMGYCTMVEVLNPAFVEVRPDPNNKSRPTYWYGSGVNKVQIPAKSLIHIPFMAMPGGNRGLSSIEYAGIAMALALAAMEFGSQWFAQGAAPSYILSTEAKLSEEEVTRIAQKFQVEHSGLKQAHLPLVVDQGLKVDKTGASADEAQFINTLDYTRMVLASYFGLPSHLVGSTANKANIWGKRAALTTPIPTPFGWTTFGDVQPGDEVFGSDGSVVRVIHTHPIEVAPESYRITFNDHTSVDVDADHLWETTTRLGHTAVRTTKEIHDTLFYGTRGDRNHRIKVTGALQLPDTDLLVDPYILGYWLGDGASAKPQFTVGSTDLAEFLEQVKLAEYYHSEPRQPLGDGVWQIWVSASPVRPGSQDSLSGKLRALGVLNNKHIPAQYLRGSIEQRTALLQGLMDSDGNAVRSRPRVEFCNKNADLARGVLELARTLGLRPTLGAYTHKATGKASRAGVQHIVGFDPKGIQPFRLSRKLFAVGGSSKKSRALYRTIVSVEPIDPVPMRCLTVDSKDHLFLCGDGMIPTHNTVEEQGYQMIDFTYSGYTKRIEEVFSFGSVFTPAGHYVRFNTDIILHADSQGTALEIFQERNAGVKTQNDERLDRYEMAPLKGADDLNAPMNTSPHPPPPPTGGVPPAAPAPAKKGAQGSAPSSEES